MVKCEKCGLEFQKEIPERHAVACAHMPDPSELVEIMREERLTLKDMMGRYRDRTKFITDGFVKRRIRLAGKRLYFKAINCDRCGQVVRTAWGKHVRVCSSLPSPEELAEELGDTGLSIQKLSEKYAGEVSPETVRKWINIGLKRGRVEGTIEEVRKEEQEVCGRCEVKLSFVKPSKLGTLFEGLSVCLDCETRMSGENPTPAWRIAMTSGWDSTYRPHGAAARAGYGWG